MNVKCIYRIKHKLDTDNDNIYIGSTSNLRKRINSHKLACNDEENKNGKSRVYEFMRFNGGFDNFQFDILELCDGDKNERFGLEHAYILVHKPTLNVRQVFGDKALHKKKYNDKNRERLNDEGREYYKENKTEINKRRCEKIKCECGSLISKAGISEHKRTKKHLKFTETD